MKNTTLGLSIVVSLIIGLGAGYAFGNTSNGNVSEKAKLQDSITMMNTQASDIQKMAELMKSSGMSMQAAGTTYKDAAVVSQGKDLEVMAEKYMGAQTKASTSGDSMGGMMGH